TPVYSPLIRVTPSEPRYFSFANSFGFDIGGFSGGAVFDRRGRIVAVQQRVAPDSLLEAIEYRSVEQWIGRNLKTVEAQDLWDNRSNRNRRRTDSVPTPARGETEIAIGAQTTFGSTPLAIQARVAHSITGLRNLQIAGEF